MEQRTCKMSGSGNANCLNKHKQQQLLDRFRTRYVFGALQVDVVGSRHGRVDFGFVDLAHITKIPGPPNYESVEPSTKNTMDL